MSTKEPELLPCHSTGTSCGLESTLALCPFCGKQAEYNINGAWVGCTNQSCHVRPVAKYYKEIDNAIKAWNTRAPVEPQPLKPC